MLTFRDVRDCIIEFAETKLKDVHVQAGKMGELSVTPPGVMVYIEPYTEGLKNQNQHPVFRLAKVILFSVVSAEENAAEGTITAVELLEDFEKYVLNGELHAFLSNHAKNVNNDITQIEYPDNWLTFEGYYQDSAIAALELIIDYCAYFRTTS